MTLAPGTRRGTTTTPDNRTIYYGAVRAEADIWIADGSSRSH